MSMLLQQVLAVLVVLAVGDVHADLVHLGRPAQQQTILRLSEMPVLRHLGE